MNEKLYIPIAIIIAGVFVGGAVYLSGRSGSSETKLTNKSAGGQILQASSMRPISADDHILGNPNADVVILEYSDTECPYCKEFYFSLQKIMDVYGKTGKVAWVYRHFPIADLHSKAPKESEATECAYDLGGQTAFWKYLTEIYTQTNSNDTLDPKQLPKIAKDVGIDVTAFNSCLASGKFTAKVQADYDDAIKTGGQGTPHTILITKDGGKLPIEGNESYEDLKNAIDLLLGNKPITN
jgi:protein-disulfide isomerase